ncbi:MAG: TRADD-N-associated membrane domain-containing protein [Actinomycetota bacterium]
MKTKPTPKPHSAIETKIANERLRQARYSFNAALIASSISACAAVAGASLLLCGKVPEGTAATSGSAAICMGCVRLAKDANDRLDKIAQELMDED